MKEFFYFSLAVLALATSGIIIYDYFFAPSPWEPFLDLLIEIMAQETQSNQ